MTQKTLIQGFFSRGGDTRWTRSFPEGSVSGESWMLDVVEDLQAYAAHRQLTEAEAILEETRDRLIRALLVD